MRIRRLARWGSLLSDYGFAGALLIHPLPIGATALLWMNDHHWKWSHTGIVTGKLSDVCGLIVFPLFVAGSIEAAAWASKRPVLLGARGVSVVAIAVGLVFAAIQLSSPAAALYRWLFGVRWLVQGWILRGDTALPNVRHTMDPTDLLALPALAIPVLLAYQLRPRPSRSRAPCSVGHRPAR